ncbi:hypothetical protein Tco_0637273 [Tanacetum coccineum]
MIHSSRNLKSFGENTSDYEHHYEEDQKNVLEDLWSDSNESDHAKMNESCLMAFGSQEEIKALLKENRILQQETNKLANKANGLEIKIEATKVIITKEVVEPCLSCEKLTHVVDSLKDDLSKLQDEALGFSKFKKSSDTIDHMFCQQKVSQDKEGLGILKLEKTTSKSLNKTIVFIKESQNKLLEKLVSSTPADAPLVRQSTERE